MGEQRVERKLAAILAADVVGYSRLMGANEVGTLRALKTLRKELVDPAVARHGGRIVKLTGDGILIEFASAVDAVASAVEVQRAVARRNAGTPQDRRIDYRVGINIGDIIVDGEDIYGDGVNVAARLQALAEPGGIRISGTVHDHVRDKLPFAFADKGRQKVKNIARPVRVYALDPDAVAALGGIEPSLAAPGSPRRRDLRRIWPVLAGVAATLLFAAGLWSVFQAEHGREGARPVGLSMVVLPFENLSHDREQEYFADGITEDLTTDLSRIPGAFVIAAHTALTFKGKPVDAKQVGRELGVRYVVEGSVQRTEEQVRLNAQLVDAQSGAQLWADRFDGDRRLLGQLQDDFTARLARSLDIQLTEAESLRAERERPNNPDAVDLAMRGRAALNQSRVRENYVSARGFFEHALSIDAKLPRALDGLSYTLAVLVLTRWSVSPDRDMARATRMAAAALDAHPDDALAHLAKGYLFVVQKRFEGALAEFETAIGDDRNLAEAYGMIGSTKTLSGRASEAFAPVETAIRLSPRDPLLNVWLFYICHAHTHLAQDEQAIEWCRKSVAAGPYWVAYVDLASAYAWTGQKAEAQDAVRELLKLMPGYTVSKWAAAGWSDNPVFLKQYTRIVEGLRKAGLPEQ